MRWNEHAQRRQQRLHERLSRHVQSAQLANEGDVAGPCHFPIAFDVTATTAVSARLYASRSERNSGRASGRLPLLKLPPKRVTHGLAQPCTFAGSHSSG